MPVVRVRLYASLRDYAPGGSERGAFTLELPPGSTLADLYARLGMPPQEAKQAFVNGRREEPGLILREGDEIGIFPPIAGGGVAVPAVQVQVFATFREVTGTPRLTVEASSVREVLSFLVNRFGEPLARRLLTPAGEVQEAVAVLVNGRNVRFLQGADTPLRAGDTVTIIPPVAGGDRGGGGGGRRYSCATSSSGTGRPVTRLPPPSGYLTPRRR
ncbi:MAG: ubiquitin-like small modifier protein 1 [Bacillota bacterium]